MKRPLASVLCVAGLLVACRPPDGVRLGWGSTFRLCAPASGPTLFETQAVEVRLHDGRVERMLTTVENGPERLSVVVSTLLGQTVFTATLEGGRTTVDTRLPLPGTLDPRLLLAAVQLAQWPADALRAGLDPSLTLREEGPTRTLLRKGAVLLVLRRSGTVVDLDLPTYGIQVRITPLEEAP